MFRADSVVPPIAWTAHPVEGRLISAAERFLARVGLTRRRDINLILDLTDTSPHRAVKKMTCAVWLRVEVGVTRCSKVHFLWMRRSPPPALDVLPVCSLRSIRPELLSQIAKMTEVIATSARKQLAVRAFGPHLRTQ